MTKPHETTSVPNALQDWRDAEQVAAVARRGRLAAQTASAAADDAEEAAKATATAARASLEAAIAAELSAQRTAKSSRAAAQAAQGDLADADAGLELADVAEAEGKAAYGRALDRATSRQEA